MTLRPLIAGDEALLEAFLVGHADSSMFLRANARRAGLEYHGRPEQALYTGVFREGRLVGVASHCSNGMLLLQAPELPAEVARACIEGSGRPVRGLLGPAAQVHAARTALCLQGVPAALDEDEGLYVLDLTDLVVPAALANGTIACRAPRADERETLLAWRAAYDIEVLGGTDSPETRARATAFLDAQIAAGNAWVALEAGVPVSLSAFNAALPDIVQLGGIYTPPALRGRGLARVAVAASLLAARERGASRAVLFTGNPSAVRTYEAVGFHRTGDYGLVLFR